MAQGLMQNFVDENDPANPWHYLLSGGHWAGGDATNIGRPGVVIKRWIRGPLCIKWFTRHEDEDGNYLDSDLTQAEYNSYKPYFLSDEQMVNTNGSPVPDYVLDILNQMTVAYHLYFNILGFRSPFNSDKLPALGYIMCQIVDKNMASELPWDDRFLFEPGVPASGWAYYFNVNRKNPSRNSSPTHELMHLLHWGYSWFKNVWYMEGTARWAQDLVESNITETKTAQQLRDMLTDPAQFAALKTSSYDSAWSFWYPLCNLYKGSDIWMPENDPILQLRYIWGEDAGRRIVADFNMYGAFVIKRLLERLDELDDVCFHEQGYRWWTGSSAHWPLPMWYETDQRNDANNQYIIQACLELINASPVAILQDNAAAAAASAEEAGKCRDQACACAASVAASRDAAATSSAAAEMHADNAEIFAGQAQSSATAAAESAAMSGEGSAIAAAESSSVAEAAALLAQQWAENPQNVPVVEGSYSALHWAETAAENVAGMQLADVATSGDYADLINTPPLAADDADGLMPKECFSQLAANTAEINALKELGGRYAGRGFSRKVDLDADAGLQGRHVGDFTWVQDDEEHNGATTRYFVVDAGQGHMAWAFAYVMEGNLPGAFATGQQGFIIGAESTARGRVFAESDGTGAVVGWDDLNGHVDILRDTALTLAPFAGGQAGDAIGGAQILLAANDRVAQQATAAFPSALVFFPDDEA